MQTTNLPEDSVEMIRAIRQKHYEETKGMSPEERYLYRQRKVEEFKKLREEILKKQDDL
jgi:hypothetical protein